MYTVYRLKANELDSNFLKSLKSLFKDKDIEIAVCETPMEDDETAYLLRSDANRERLMKALENVSQRRDLVTISLDEIQ